MKKNSYIYLIIVGLFPMNPIIKSVNQCLAEKVSNDNKDKGCCA